MDERKKIKPKSARRPRPKSFLFPQELRLTSGDTQESTMDYKQDQHEPEHHKINDSGDSVNESNINFNGTSTDNALNISTATTCLLFICPQCNESTELVRRIPISSPEVYMKNMNESLSEAKRSPHDMRFGGLGEAETQHEELGDAKMQHDELGNIEIQINVLSDAEIQRNALSDAEIQRNRLSDAEIQRNALSDAEIQRNRLSDAEMKSGDAEMQHEDAEMKLEDAEMKLEDAEMKLEDAEIKHEDAEMKLEDAEMKLEDAEMKREYVKMKREDAEMMHGDAEIKCEDSKIQPGFQSEEELNVADTIVEISVLRKSSNTYPGNVGISGNNTLFPLNNSVYYEKDTNTTQSIPGFLKMEFEKNDRSPNKSREIAYTGIIRTTPGDRRIKRKRSHSFSGRLSPRIKKLANFPKDVVKPMFPSQTDSSEVIKSSIQTAQSKRVDTSDSSMEEIQSSGSNDSLQCPDINIDITWNPSLKLLEVEKKSTRLKKYQYDENDTNFSSLHDGHNITEQSFATTVDSMSSFSDESTRTVWRMSPNHAEDENVVIETEENQDVYEPNAINSEESFISGKTYSQEKLINTTSSNQNLERDLSRDFDEAQVQSKPEKKQSDTIIDEDIAYLRGISLIQYLKKKSEREALNAKPLEDKLSEFMFGLGSRKIKPDTMNVTENQNIFGFFDTCRDGNEKYGVHRLDSSTQNVSYDSRKDQEVGGDDLGTLLKNDNKEPNVKDETLGDARTDSNVKSYIYESQPRFNITLPRADIQNTNFKNKTQSTEKFLPGNKAVRQDSEEKNSGFVRSVLNIFQSSKAKTLQQQEEQEKNVDDHKTSRKLSRSARKHIRAPRQRVYAIPDQNSSQNVASEVNACNTLNSNCEQELQKSSSTNWLNHKFSFMRAWRSVSDPTLPSDLDENVWGSARDMSSANIASEDDNQIHDNDDVQMNTSEDKSKNRKTKDEENNKH